MDDKQMTFCDLEIARRKKNLREEFLQSMDALIPWPDWIALIRPHYPDGKVGCPVRGIETMLCMYLLQVWFSLSAEGVEESISDSYAMRKFMKLNFPVEQTTDATTLLRFRHLLEKHNIGEMIFADIKQRLEKSGLIMHGGTIVDATLIQAHCRPTEV